MAWAQALKRIIAALRGKGLLASVPFDATRAPFLSDVSPDHVEVADASWVDDTVCLLSAETPWSLVDKIRETITIVCRIARDHGLKVNLKKGKTEVLL